VAGRCNSSFYFTVLYSICIKGMAPLINAKLPMLSQVEAIRNLSVRNLSVRNLSVRNLSEF
jgi:hypothetical protein